MENAQTGLPSWAAALAEQLHASFAAQMSRIFNFNKYKYLSIFGGLCTRCHDAGIADSGFPRDRNLTTCVCKAMYNNLRR